MPTIAERIAEMKAEADRLEAEAKAAGLSEDDKALAAERERAQAAIVAAAAALSIKRANDMADRVRAATIKANGAYHVTGVDLVNLFPLGKAPPADRLPPGGGVIVVRDSAPDEGYLVRELEHKNVPGARGVDELMIDVASKAVVDPDTSGSDGTGQKVRTFFERYPAAAMQVASEARRLGGAKVREAKRGSE